MKSPAIPVQPGFLLQDRGNRPIYANGTVSRLNSSLRVCTSTTSR